jgi:triosephosphate isomerase
VIEEPEEVINAKTKAVLASGNQCVLCVGETLEQRKAGEADAVNERQVRSALAGVRDDAQLENLVIAYEPVWAIGTGQTATPDDAQRAHERIRALIGTLYGSAIAARLRIIYGGSVKPSNAAELFAQPDIDGGLIGGASLKIGDFAAIAKTAGGSPSEG